MITSNRPMPGVASVVPFFKKPVAAHSGTLAQKNWPGAYREENDNNHRDFDNGVTTTPSMITSNRPMPGVAGAVPFKKAPVAAHSGTLSQRTWPGAYREENDNNHRDFDNGVTTTPSMITSNRPMPGTASVVPFKKAPVAAHSGTLSQQPTDAEKAKES